MKRALTSIIIAAALMTWGTGEAVAAPGLTFVGATPADGATVAGSSVEIEVEIVEPALASMTFNWNGTDHVIHDDSTVLMFNFDNVATLLEDYSTPGGLVKDLSSWQNDGTVGIGDDPTTVPEWLVDGRYGGAFDFAGNGSTFGQSILVIPHDSSLNPDGGDFAIAVWVLPRSDIDGDILRKGSTGTASTWYKLEHSPSPSDNKFSLNFNTDGTDATVNSPQAYNDDQWHFIVAQRRGGTAELWIDGSLVGSAGVSGSISNGANLTVGSKDDQADDFINATLDEVRIYMRSFTEDQMQVLYNSNLSRVDLDTWYFYVNQTNLAGGTYTYQASATNASSETGTAGPRTFTVDVAAPPTVTLDSPADGSVLDNTDVTFVCSATDDEGLVDATLYVGATETVTLSGATDTDDAQLYETDDSSTPEVEGPDTNAGSAVSINVDSLNPHAHAVIKFPNLFGPDPGQVPPGSSIVSATLEVNCTNQGNMTELYRLTEDWSEATVTWNSAPAYSAAPVLPGDCTAAGWRTIDITQFVQEWSSGADNYGIILTDTGTDGVDFDTSESANPPVLTITYLITWQPIQSKLLSGMSDTVTFDPVTLADEQDYVWNCLVTDSSALGSWAPADFHLTVDTGQVPPVPVIIKGPYLQQVTENSIVIMWETDVAADSRVDFGGTFVEDPTLVTIHEMWLTTGLSADTVYAYTVTSGTTTSPASTFATAPASPRSFRFVAYGDTRTQPAEHAAVVQAIISSAPEIVVQTGDLVENGRDYAAWQTEFFDPAYDLMIYTPMLPILGNHEYNGTGPLWFLDFFSLGNNDEWFAFTYGGVRFIGLNTCVDYTPTSAQYGWLATELQSTAYSDATWHVVYFHHPPYSATSSHGDDANVKQYLVPLFEQNGVDIVFNGHSHAYERYFNNGIYYIVTGGGGAPLASLVTDNQEPIREYGESVYHHCTIDVDVPGQSLTVSALYNSGTVFDTITITKTAKASNPSPANGAEDVPVDTVLSWTAGTDAVSHDVYFGTADPPTFIQNQAETTYDPGALDPGTTYYWAIDEHDSGGTVTDGDVWSFTTKAVLPWSDGFESGDFSAGGWTSGGDATVGVTEVYSGTYGAQMRYSGWIEKAVNTTGFTDIHVKYARNTNRLDSGEYLYVEWSDGSNWHTLESPQDTSWLYQDMACGAGADNNPGFRVRFRIAADKVNEYAYIDEVQITGTPAVPFHDVAVMAMTAPASVVAGDTATIDVTVENQGTFGETFDVTLTDTPPQGGTAGAVTDSPQTIFLGPGAFTTLSFTWDTASATLGDHSLDATAGPVTGETDTEDNSMSTVVSVQLAVTDIAITAVSAPSSVVQGNVVNVDVTVENVGNQNVTGDIAVTLTDGTDSVTIGTETVVGGLAVGASTVLTYSWDTSGATIGDHTLNVSHDFADDNASNNSMSTTSTVTDAGTTIHVQSIDVGLEQAGKNYKGVATVLVSQAQSGGSVIGNWHLGAVGTTDDKLIREGATATTDGTGTAVIVSVPKKAKSGEIFTFVVTDVVLSGYTYAPGDNVETDDSSTPVP